MRNATPRDGELGRSWGKWFRPLSERRTAMVHAHERARAKSDAAIARLTTADDGECRCGCKGDPFICIEADGT